MTQTRQEKITQARAFLRLAVDGEQRARRSYDDARVAVTCAQDRLAVTSNSVRVRARDLVDAQRRLDDLLDADAAAWRRPDADEAQA